jgi:hypothetical protein
MRVIPSNQRQAPTCSSTLHELVRSIRRRSIQETLHFEMYREQDTALRTHAEERNKISLDRGRAEMEA